MDNETMQSWCCVVETHTGKQTVVWHDSAHPPIAVDNMQVLSVLDNDSWADATVNEHRT